METFLDCIPCFIRQALEASRMVSDDERLAERVMRRVLAITANMRMDRSPPWIGREIHRIIREETGCADPYAELKDQSTRYALQLLDTVRREIADAPDRFDAAVRYSLAGNVIDFALSDNVSRDQIEENLAAALDKSLAIDDIPKLKEAVNSAGDILVIGDNAGETVFDLPLLEMLPSGHVTYGVKGSPIINDATRADAEAAGIGDLAVILDNGNDAPGTILESCSPEFRDCFMGADVVISKGQANFETLSGVDRDIFFLTQVKCAVVSRNLDAGVGDWLVIHQQPGTIKA